MADTEHKHSIIYRIFGAVEATNKNRKLEKSFRNLNRGIRQFKAGLLGMRGMMIGFASSLVGVGLGIRRTITAYEEITQSQSRLRTTLAAGTESYRRNASMASEVAERVAVDLGYSLREGNDTMNTMIQTGLGVHASMRLIGSAMRLARIAEMDTTQSTRFLVDTMNMFRGEMRDDNLTLQEFADTMSGRLAVAANMASTNIEQLQNAFRYAGTELSSLGYKSHEVMSALAGLSVVGLRGSTAGTRLRGAMSRLIRPTESVRRAVREATGGQVELSNILHDSSGNLRPLNEAMAQLMQIMGRLPTAQQRAQLEVAIFGQRSLAAGMSLSEYNEASRRMLTIGREIRNSQSVRTRLMRMEEERMKSFGMQMQQLREGTTDLAIAFGEVLFGSMDKSREGFGKYVRNVAQAIRFITAMNAGNNDAKRQFNALSPELRNTAKNIHEFFINVAELIKTLAKVAKWIGWFIMKYPYFSAALLGIRVAFGGWIPAMFAASRGLIALGGRMTIFGSQAAVATRGASLFKGGLALLIVYITGKATRALQDWGLKISGCDDYMKKLKKSTVAAHADIAKGIPIIGDLVSQYVELFGVIQEGFRVAHAERQRLKSTYERGIGATAEERTEARFQRIRGRGIAAGASEDELRLSAARRMETEAMQESATMMLAMGLRQRDQIRQRLAQEGIAGERLNELTSSIVRAQGNMDEGIASTDALRMSRMNALGQRDLAGSLGDSVRQLSQFGPLVRAANDALASSQFGIGTASGATEGEIAQQSIPTAQDAYVRQGGLMGVSSGDLIVSRRHLANAVLARQGAMAGPAVNMASENTIVGPQPSVAGGAGGGEITINVPVIVDGREIARAVGRANITQLERGGGNIGPGQRRSLRETGFRRSV